MIVGVQRTEQSVGIIVGDFLEQTPSQSATFSATSPRFL